jgi:hypothetical protein
MTGNNHPTHFPGVLRVFTSPAVVVSVLLALLGAYLWTDHREEALVAFLWIPIFLTCWVMHSLFHSRHPRSSAH